MKLIVSIVDKDDAVLALDALITNKFQVTMSQTTGGFLRQGNVTLFTGIDDDKVDEVVKLIRENCQKREQEMTMISALTASGELQILKDQNKIRVGGAVIFVLDVERFIKS